LIRDDRLTLHRVMLLRSQYRKHPPTLLRTPAKEARATVVVVLLSLHVRLKSPNAIWRLSQSIKSCPSRMRFSTETCDRKFGINALTKHRKILDVL
jgi:hypothetical protein